jgi:hypothetical protein
MDFREEPSVEHSSACGTGQNGDERSRHVHLRASEAKAVAYALLFYTEQLSNG